MSPETGSRVSHYRLVRPLGRGGMGEVFLAEDDQLNRLVAIKFLIGPADEHARKRLLQEARAAAALDHPAICAIHEIGSDPVHGDFIVMQHIEGESLSARLQRGRMTPDEALKLAARIGDGLATAHAHGVVHRDLKPHNVMLTPAGDPKLLDFGLAKRAAESPAAAAAETTSQLTQPHAVMGTPGYMAPEQVRSQPTDARTDLFALGCVLFECLTGTRAFGGTTSADVAADVLHKDPPPVSSLAPGLNAAHDAVVSRLLKKDPGDRFQSAADLVGSIRALVPVSTEAGRVSAAGPTPVSARPTRSRVIWALVAATAVLALVTSWSLGGWPWGGRLPAPPDQAAGWYARGVAALREGTYASARSAFEEAVRLFPNYALAHLRLAEAHSELDDELNAQAALLRASALVPDSSRLRADDRLRLEAIRASVLRDTQQAVDAYRRLAERHPKDAPGWVDVGRAEEAAPSLAAAADAYEKALAIDSQYAAAHMRLGWVRAQSSRVPDALAALDEAIRLYQAAGHAEGEAEAQLRKGRVLTPRGRYREARTAHERVVQLTSDPQFVLQRVRAGFELARLTAVEGKLADAETMGSEAVKAATDAGLNGVAADGLVDLAYMLMVQQQFSAADAHLARAVDLAGNGRARRTEARARLQQASLRLQTGDNEGAVQLSEAPLRFMAEKRYIRAEADGKIILSRAHENLEHYDEAARLATDVLGLAERLRDEVLSAVALENLAGQLTKQGRLPEALAHRERIEKIHRAQNDHLALPYDIPNRAELLIYLGRGDEAKALLDEVSAKIAEGADTYRRRRRRVALLRAVLESVSLRFASVPELASEAIRLDTPPKPAATGAPPPAPDSTARFALVLDAHAKAQRGLPHAPAAALQEWVKGVSPPASRREASYWAARTLIAGKHFSEAHALATAAWSEAGAQGNAELRWRLAAVAGLAARGLAVTPNGATMLGHATTDRQVLESTWRDQAMSYFARPDLALLRRTIS